MYTYETWLLICLRVEALGKAKSSNFWQFRYILRISQNSSSLLFLFAATTRKAKRQPPLRSKETTLNSPICVVQSRHSCFLQGHLRGIMMATCQLRTLSSLELLLVKLQQTPEEEQHDDGPPALPSRPVKISRRPSVRKKLPLNLRNSSCDQEYEKINDLSASEGIEKRGFVDSDNLKIQVNLYCLFCSAFPLNFSKLYTVNWIYGWFNLGSCFFIPLNFEGNCCLFTDLHRRRWEAACSTERCRDNSEMLPWPPSSALL